MDIRLECSRGPCEGRSITLKLGRHGIGRELDNALRVAEDDAASAHHAAVLVRTTATVLEDQGSHNGTHLNGVRLCVPTVLGEGDLIRIGVSEWRFMRLAGDAVTVDPEPQPLVLEVTATHEVDEPRLLVLDGPHRGRVLEVKAAEPVVIGRSPRADLVINDTFVSREHATFFRRGDEVAVLDNDSSNGVYVNGERIRMIHLTDGDEVRIGRTHFRFVALGSPLPGLE
ncbi:MAG: FHA domain-containing protein, partial [Armatimonadetes bacterium]|nr:FHA domain-containing protein [Armatimonadota bacterium]